MLAEQGERRRLVLGGDDAQKPQPMLKTSCISSSENSPRSWIRSKTGGTGSGCVDLVADLGREPQQVAEAAGGEVGEAAHVDLGAQQLDAPA